jgi:RNA polymerase primary sigma factor
MEMDDTSGQLKQLVQIGKDRGYILYDEIDELLTSALEREADLEIVLTELAANGIEVLEEPGARSDVDFTAGDEVFTGRDFQELTEEPEDSSVIRTYLREVLITPRRTREDEIELAKRISHGGEDSEEAMRQLIEANLYLVVASAKRHGGPGYSLLELIQEGNIGLMKAAERYKHTREYRFSTYAIWWIRRSIAWSKLKN